MNLFRASCRQILVSLLSQCNVRCGLCIWRLIHYCTHSQCTLYVWNKILSDLRHKYTNFCYLNEVSAPPWRKYLTAMGFMSCFYYAGQIELQITSIEILTTFADFLVYFYCFEIFVILLFSCSFFICRYWRGPITNIIGSNVFENRAKCSSVKCAFS